MNTLKLITALTAGLALTACGQAPLETASRNAPAPLPSDAAGTLTQEARSQAETASYDVVDVRVTVPRTLEVSEANRFYPGGDIVWREDPPGDRHAQVRKIVEDAMRKGARASGAGDVPVVLDVEVTRFHALTEKARYTVGGVHALQFNMQLRDAETGAPLGEPHFVKADFKALGGQAAVRAEQAGLTQKKRITDHLANVIRTELTSPGGYRAANLGLMGALNQL
ncbi:DUF6778 family protein [Roseovarius salis]|uniref:DUF6778 family protein n=1 Tax=Roseovarius salis TaxID=3376063 RepID=UPI0037CBB4B6